MTHFGLLCPATTGHFNPMTTASSIALAVPDRGYSKMLVSSTT
jgi:hypothetical protein